MGLQLTQSNRREQDGRLKVKQHALLGEKEEDSREISHQGKGKKKTQ